MRKMINKNIHVTLLIIYLLFMYGCYTPSVNPWISVNYYEKNLYRDTNSYLFHHPNRIDYDIEKYSDYYINDLFVGITSDHPSRNIHLAYDFIKPVSLKIFLQAPNRIEYEKIIIHNIQIISRSGINYEAQINEIFPVEILIDEAYERVKYINNPNRFVRFEGRPGGIILRNLNIINGILTPDDSLDIEYTPFNSYIRLEEYEEINCIYDIEIIKQSEVKRKQINFIIIPRVNTGTIRWNQIH